MSHLLLDASVIEQKIESYRKIREPIKAAIVRNIKIAAQKIEIMDFDDVLTAWLRCTEDLTLLNFMKEEGYQIIKKIN